MKKAVAFLLSVLLLIAAVPLGALSVSATVVENGLKYRIDTNEAIVVGYTYLSGSHLIIPDEIYGCPVIAIGEDAFRGCSKIEQITLPHHLTIIGNNAFTGTGYYNDASHWENDVLYLDEYLIEARTSVSGNYVIKEGTLTLADNAFEECSDMSAITFPKSLIAIGNNTFLNCDKLESVEIPDTVTVMGWHAFRSCNGLKAVTIGSGLTEIPPHAFSICLSLESITFGENVHIIGEQAFYYCGNLRSVSIPESVETIHSGAFRFCSSLESIYISKNVSYIHGTAFNLCWGLKTIEVADDNPYYCALDDVLFDKEMTTLLQYPLAKTGKTYVVPDGVAYIGDGSFDACVQLVTLYLPVSVIWIGTSALNDSLFGDKDSLYYVLYGGSKEAWQNVVIESENERLNNATKIFSACLPEDHVYTADCDNLCNNCKWERLNPIDSHTNNDEDMVHCDVCFSDLLQYTVVNGGAVITAFSANPQKHLEIPSAIDGYPVTGIKASVFKNTGLNTIALPPTLTFIEKDAFSSCGSLTSVYITDLTAWCDVAFANSASNPLNGAENLYVNDTLVTALAIPQGVQTINPYVFYGYDNLSTIFLPNTVTSILTGAFDGCTKLTDVYYAGSEADRTDVFVDTTNQHLLNATWHYNTCAPNEHIYASDCDRVCEKCDWTRDDTATHAYDTTCDTTCNLCGEIRTIEHTYSAPCDPNCDVCGAVRTELVHTYTNASDPDCNYCGAQRDTNYIYAGVDTVVNIESAYQSVDFVFVPTKTSWYRVHTLTELGMYTVVYCSIFDADSGKELYYFHGPMYFKENCQLAEGHKYIVRVGYGFSQTGSYTMRIDPLLDGFDYTIRDEKVTIVGYIGTPPSTLVIPDEIEGYPVTAIGYRAFNNIQEITTLNIPGSVTLIDEEAFYNCDGLVSVTLGDGVDSISVNAFSCCSNLVSFYLPASVTWIGTFAFYACNEMTDIYYGGSEQERENIKIGDANYALDRVTWHYNYTPESTIIPGDANVDGKVNNRDLGLFQQYLNEWEVIINEDAMDVNEDERINNRDLGLLQQYLNEWDVELK